MRLTPPRALTPVDRDIPGDPSSAAFLAALVALSPGREIVLADVCVSPTRGGFFAVLQRMGAALTVEDARDEGGEPVASVRVRGAPGLRAASISPSEVPSMIDELPLVACVGARADGETLITGAEELRVKESDRIAAVVDGLRAVGADAEERPDGLRVAGSDRPLRGRVVTHGDHRLAMGFGVLGALPGNDIEVDDPACVAVSYPSFWRDLAQLSA